MRRQSLAVDKQQPVGIVAYSFALRRPEQEPNRCNLAIARQVLDRVRAHPGAVVAAQWEVALGLQQLGYGPRLVVGLPADGSYLDSERVWSAAAELFTTLGITQVMPIAQPFLQLTKVRTLTRRSGFGVLPDPVQRIGFDRSPQNLQWWTRGPMRLLTYAVLQRLFGYRGRGAASSLQH